MALDKIISATPRKDRFTTTYTVVFEKQSGEQYKHCCMSEPQYKFEVLKRKLVEQYKIPSEVLGELEDVIEGLETEYHNMMSMGEDL
jgi:hypothetical protein